MNGGMNAMNCQLKIAYLENTFEKTLWFESPVFGADSELSLLALSSPVNPSISPVNGYERRFNILFFLLLSLLVLIVLLCSCWLSLLSSTLKLTLEVFLRPTTVGSVNDVPPAVSLVSCDRDGVSM